MISCTYSMLHTARSQMEKAECRSSATTSQVPDDLPSAASGESRAFRVVNTRLTICPLHRAVALLLPPAYVSIFASNRHLLPAATDTIQPELDASDCLECVVSRIKLLSSTRFQRFKTGFTPITLPIGGGGPMARETSLRIRGQFMVAPPQQRLYFFPEPHGHRSFRPTLEALRRGSGVKVLPIWACRCSLKYR